MKISSGELADQLRMLQNGPRLNRPEEKVPTKPEGSVSFGDFLKSEFDKVNQHGLEADRAIEASVQGEQVNPHTTMLAIQKAEISFRLLMSVKDKLEQAYRQLVQTQI